MPHTHWSSVLDSGKSHGLVDSAVDFVNVEIIGRFGVILPLAVTLLVVLTCIYHDRLIFTKPSREGIFDVPGSLPLIGHTHQIIKLGTRQQYHRFAELAAMSPTHSYRLTFAGVGTILMFNRPEYLEYIQKTNFENFPKGRQLRRNLGDLLSHDGIFVADGDVWKTQRKMAAHMFSANKFNTWVRQVVHAELNVIDALLEQVASQNDFSTGAAAHSTMDAASRATQPRGGAIVLPELFFRYTLSSFAKMAFAADLGCLTESPASLQKPHPFAVAFDHAQGVMNDRFVNPIWELTERFMPYGAKMRESIKTVRTFGMAIIEQRLAEENGSEKKEKSALAQVGSSDLQQSMLKNEGKDLLALFMEHTKDPEALLTVVLNFLIAGRDTTAQTLSWLFYELMDHPEHVEHIRREVDQVFGPDAASRRSWVKYDEFRKLPYTLACVHEAARLHPAVPKNGKEVLRDDVIVPQGPNPHNLPPVKVYKGERVGWSDWVMNRLPEVWGEDAAEFNPQRFLSFDESTQQWQYVQQSQWNFHVFNAGPRLCLGMNLANYESVAFIAATLQKYDFTWCTKEQGQSSDWPPTYTTSVTHPMKDSYHCIVTKRKV